MTLRLTSDTGRAAPHWFRRTLERQEDVAVLYWTEEEPDLDFEEALGTEGCVADA